MTAATITGLLAERVMGWGVAPDRYLLGNRCWMPRWKFQPLARLDHAFQLLDKSGGAYTLTTRPGGGFTAEVRLDNRTGAAAGGPKAATITIAVARAIGLDVPDELLREVTS
jgi:hypothetical protein